jgi:conjugative transposon TraM protein
MKQMDDMLSKILDIQHPERVKERIKERSLQQKDKAFVVCKLPALTTISLLDTEKISAENSFFGMDDVQSKEDQNAIEAVVHQNQVLVDGAVIKLRLLDDIYIESNLIPKESFVFGICSLNGERLEVEINSIRCNNSLFPVKLAVYDMDGLPGIYIPGAITRDVTKQSADNSLQLMELTSLDPSLKAQATATGINAMKNLLSKKARLVKVTVKAGYKVLLMQKDNS